MFIPRIEIVALVGESWITTILRSCRHQHSKIRAIELAGETERILRAMFPERFVRRTPSSRNPHAVPISSRAMAAFVVSSLADVG